MSQRTEVFQGLRTRQFRYQNPDNTYPAVGGVMAVSDIRGTVEPTLTPVLRQMGLVGPTSTVGELTFDGTQLLVNGVPIGGGGGGVGATGPRGPRGLVGATGPQGLEGATGPQGLAGVTGPQGLVGPTGPQGAPMTISATNGQFLFYNGSGAAGAAGLRYAGGVVEPRTHIIPDVSGANAYDLGSSETPFRDLYVGTSVNIGRLHLTASSDYVHVRGATAEYVLEPNPVYTDASGTTRLGNGAGAQATATNAVAIGTNAGGGETGPGGASFVAIGDHAGWADPGANSVAIGRYAGGTNSGAGSVAIGQSAGSLGLGLNSVAIGNDASAIFSADHSICINASGVGLNPTAAGLFVAPIREDASGAVNFLSYNTDTKEVVVAQKTPVDVSGSVFATLVDPSAGFTPYTITGSFTAAGNYMVAGVVLIDVSSYGKWTPGANVNASITINGFQTHLQRGLTINDYPQCFCFPFTVFLMAATGLSIACKLETPDGSTGYIDTTVATVSWSYQYVPL